MVYYPVDFAGEEEPVKRNDARLRAEMSPGAREAICRV